LKEDIIGDLEYDGIVDKIEQEEIKDNSLTNLTRPRPNLGTGCRVPDHLMHTNPGKNPINLHNIAPIPSKVTTPQKDHNDRRRRYNRPINIQRSNNRYYEVVDQ
jgi:hypothetical protein